MEDYPFKPFQSPEQPEQTGEESAYRKRKKKTARIPLPVTLPTSDELPPEVSLESAALQKPETVLEELFARETRTPEAEVSEAPADLAQFEAEDTSEQQPAEMAPDIEAEFVSEAPIIITKSESLVPEVDDSPQETVPYTPEVHIDDAPELSEPEQVLRQSAAVVPERIYEMPVAAGREMPAQQAIELQPQPAMPEAERQAMFDPSSPFTERVSAPDPNPERARKEQANAVYRAERRGVRRGVLSGALVGWWIGRRGKRQALHSAEAALKSRDKEIKKLTTEHELAAERMLAMKRTQETLQQLVDVPRTSSLAEAPKHGVVSEKAPNPQPEAKPAQAVAPEEQAITEQTYAVGSDRRVETSAWHRYEVDRQTGKLIDNPEIAYGQEFQKETKQEKLQREAAEPQVAVQLGQTILASGAATSAQQHAAAPNHTQNTTPLAVKQPHFMRQQVVRQTKNPLTWIVAIAIVVVLFIAGALS